MTLAQVKERGGDSCFVLITTTNFLFGARHTHLHITNMDDHIQKKKIIMLSLSLCKCRFVTELEQYVPVTVLGECSALGQDQNAFR